MMDTNICKNCVFGMMIPRQKGVRGEVDLSQPEMVQCRRFPPGFYGKQYPEWPTMLTDHWCGEFRPRNPN